MAEEKKDLPTPNLRAILQDLLKIVQEIQPGEVDIPLSKLDCFDLTMPWSNTKLTSYIAGYFANTHSEFRITENNRVLPPYVGRKFLTDGTTAQTMGQLLEEGSVFADFYNVEELSQKNPLVTAMSFNGGDFFVKEEKEETSDNLKRLVFYEYVVGLIMNTALETIPFFPATFGMVALPHPDARFEDAPDKLFLLREFGAGTSFMDAIRLFSTRTEDYFTDLTEVWDLIRVIKMVIEEAYAKYGFLHQNLHLYNIILRPLDGYYLYKGIPIRYIPFIIDLGNAQVRYGEKVFNKVRNDIWYDMIQMMWGLAIKSHPGARLIDVFRSHAKAPISQRISHKQIGEMFDSEKGKLIYAEFDRRFNNRRRTVPRGTPMLKMSDEELKIYEPPVQSEEVETEVSEEL